MRRSILSCPRAAMLLYLLSAASPQASAQDVLVNFEGAVSPDWNVAGNWNPANVPEAGFNEVALIGAGRSVFVANAPVSPGGVIMDSSTLEIRSGGNLTVVPGATAAGNVVMGQALPTNLIVKRGGSLTAQNLTTGGGAATTLTLGETGGAGTSALSITGGTLNRNTRIVGPNVNFASSGGLTFGGTSVLNPVITGATHSTINVTGTAVLDGVVRPEFSGLTPAIGSSWNLVTAGDLVGAFAVDASLAPAGPRGTRYIVTKSATTATLRYSNLLILNVDRTSGAVKIENAVGSAIGLDGYTIASPDGALSGTWNSLQDQGIAAWDEADNSSNSRRTEFKTTGTTSINVGSPLSLGSLFTPTVPSGFGVEPGANLSFQYSVPGQGTLNGLVEFTGRVNNMVLTINPATGEAAIQNDSPYFNVSFDAYTITSAAGKLLTGNAAWSSLQDQGLTAWDQADNADANRLTEFKTSGSTAMNGGGTVLDLGAPVNIAGGIELEDFGFEFHLSTGETRTGVVKFGALPTGTLPGQGDYDDDGDVDGADFLRWQRTIGTTANPPGSAADGNGNGVIDGGDLTAWKGSFGPGAATASGAAVPEPSTWMLAALGLMGFNAERARRQARTPRGGK